MNHILYFEHSNGDVSKVKEFGGNLSDKELYDESYRQMDKFCKKHNYIIPYTRLWNEDGVTVFDVGSHTEFFICHPRSTSWPRFDRGLYGSLAELVTARC